MRAVMFAVCVVAALFTTASGSAQSWSAGRAAPPLWQIVSIDRSGEPGWPYGVEDVAGDGLGRFEADEAEVDLRTVYADADADRTWLRSYVAATRQPSSSFAVYFFIDTDNRESTGGSGSGTPLPPALADDPPRGGYETVIGISGRAIGNESGSVIGVWHWNGDLRAMVPVQTRPGALRTALGVARDPLAIGVSDRGYVQVDLENALSGLNASCGARIYVRTVNDATPPRAFDDDTGRGDTCRGPVDIYGDPIIIRGFACRADSECPNGGRCRDGVCLFAYDCRGDVDCPLGQRCTANQCVRAIDTTCDSAGDCDGLVCESGRCVSCAESGPRACSGGEWCSPNGSCLDTDGFDPTSGMGRVQGGAFHCAAGSSSKSGFATCSLLLGVLAVQCVRRRRRRGGERDAARAGEVSR